MPRTPSPEVAAAREAGELGDTLYDVAVQSATRSRRGGDERL